MTSYPPIFSTSAHSDSSAVRDVTINCGGFASPRKSSKILRQFQCATSDFEITTCTGLRFKHAIEHLRSLASNNFQSRVLKTSWTKRSSLSYSPTNNADKSFGRILRFIRSSAFNLRVSVGAFPVGVAKYTPTRLA